MTGSLTWQMLRDLKTSEFTQAGDKWHESCARSASDRAQVDRENIAGIVGGRLEGIVGEKDR
ncbi:hypothetical protein [Streptomyces sp. NPDC102283]|uniref:hypothetical protein n=1 Tax=Streptomyces sp. NPDC102283 TaxID=3366155 RepID=UPI003820A873